MVPQSKTHPPGRRQRKASAPAAIRPGPGAGPATAGVPQRPPPEPPAVRRVVVGAEQSGQRLDNFLLRLAKGVPKSHVYRIVRSGEVRVNGGRSSAEYRLAEGDELRIPPMRLPQSEPRPVAPAQMPAILYEDEHLLILDKPSGMTSTQAVAAVRRLSPTDQDDIARATRLPQWRHGSAIAICCPSQLET